MKHMLLAFSTLFLVPLLSGCCSCGGGYSAFSDPCGSTPCGASYNGCLQADNGRRVNYGTSGGCSNCQADETFSLPPETGGSQPYTTSMPAYGQPIYGQETYGPEVVGPQFVPGDGQWTQQGAPTMAPGSPMPVTPAAPYANGGSNVLTPPMPIPAVTPSSNVIPSPSPYAPSSQSGAGPMMTVPPPPAEPISQMRYRTYR